MQGTLDSLLDLARLALNADGVVALNSWALEVPNPVPASMRSEVESALTNGPEQAEGPGWILSSNSDTSALLAWREDLSLEWSENDRILFRGFAENYAKQSSEVREHLDRTSDQVILLDRDYRIQYLNRAALEDGRRYGLELVVGAIVWDLLPQAPDLFRPAYEDAFVSGTSGTLSQYYPELEVWVEQSFYPSSQGLWVYSRNVTKQRVREQEEKERFSVILKGIGVGVWYCDLPFDVLQWDALTKEHFGLSPEAVVTIETFYDIIVLADREPTRLAIAESIASKKPYDTIYRTLGPDGKLRWIRALGHTSYGDDGAPNRFDGITLDVSKQYQLEQEMFRSEQRYRSLVEATSAIVWISDPQGRFLQPQRAWETYTGQSWDEHRGTGWTSVVHKDDVEKVWTNFKEARQAKATYHASGRLWHQPSESFRHFEVRAVPLMDYEGNIKEWVGTVYDVQERRESELTALRANRMKSEFLANMSHELRTPMTGVQGMVDLLLDTPLETGQRDFVETIRECSQSLLAVLDDVLDLSRIEAGKLLIKSRAYELQPAIASTLSLFALQAEERGLELRVKIDSQVPPALVGDPDRVRQILVNLVSNAMKFTPEGFVELRVEVVDSWLSFEVEDSGIGISQEDQKKLFRPFVQLDSSTARRYHGTGLGLSIVLRLVEIMGGQLGLRSQPGKGSVFWFQLPMILPTEEDQPQNFEESEFTAEPATILLVEDNPINRRVVQAQLEKLGHEVAWASRGTEALNILRHREFDLVLMDCQMPELDGYDTTRRLRSDGITTPVIALTAHAMDGERERCLAAGMDDYLTKPLSKADFIRTLSVWLGRSRQPKDE